MGTTLNDTPSADRTHIAFFGRMNSGKSSLVNALTGQETAIVSPVSGTTTDPVRKPMEIHGIGPCVLIDTAGFDDMGELGGRRVAQAKKAAQQADLAVLVFSAKNFLPEKEAVQENVLAKDFLPEHELVPEMEKPADFALEKRWFDLLRKQDTPVVLVVSQTDRVEETAGRKLSGQIESEFHQIPLTVSAHTGAGITELRKELVLHAADTEPVRFITGNLVQKTDIVLLVMPQDIQAPKGRLILPQVQTLRELLDKKCVAVCTTTDQLEQALAALRQPPKLIITDSQAYQTVYEKKPEQSRLTSFSTLFAAYKGDIDYFVQGARVMDALTENDRVLIAECCTHAPLDEDIGREKLPRLLRRKIGAGLSVEIVSGADFPQDLSAYRLIIQCGACMFNRKYVMARVNAAKEQGIAMTNYGVAIAYLNGILGQVELVRE